jgi:CDP-glucose 4,6-dehydratase
VAGEAFNFSTEKPLTVFEIVETIKRVMHLEHLEPLLLNNTKGEIKSQYLDAGKAKKVLGWHPRYNLEQGLRETISWYEGHFKTIERQGHAGED